MNRYRGIDTLGGSKSIYFCTGESIVSLSDHLKHVLTGRAKTALQAHIHVIAALFQSLLLFLLCRLMCGLLNICGATTPQLQAGLLSILTRVSTALATVYVLTVYWYRPAPALRLLKQQNLLDFPFIAFHDPYDKTVLSTGSALLMKCVGQPQSEPAGARISDCHVLHKIGSKTKEVQRMVWISDGLHDLNSTSPDIIFNNAITFVDDVLRQRTAFQEQ
jgi:hypothetical protein